MYLSLLSCRIMVHQHWLLFSFLWLLTAANQRGIITVEFNHKSDLSRCQSCLVDIAGLERLSLTSISTNDLSIKIAKFQASGQACSFISAELDCRHETKCGSVTVTILEHVESLASSSNLQIAVNEQLKPLCILTSVQTSFDCGLCLRMTSSSEGIQKLKLITMDTKEYYLHVLHTHQRNIFEPCSLSGVCSGIQYEFDAEYCDHLVKKLFVPRPYSSEHVIFPSPVDYTGPQELASAVRAIHWTVEWEPQCIQFITSQKPRRKCLACMSHLSSGMALLVALSSIEYGYEGYREGDTQYLFFVIVEVAFDFYIQCDETCGRITFHSLDSCIALAIKTNNVSPSQGKIYYNMVQRDLKKKEAVQETMLIPQTSSCMWVEHELGEREWCKVCLQHLSKIDAKILSSIDFLVLSEESLHTISGCISFGSELGMKLCKKVTPIPDQFCHSFDMLPSSHGYNIVAPSLPKIKHLVSTGRPKTPDIDCFTCLTSTLDILITDLVRFWMVGFPEESTCYSTCGTLNMDGRQVLDISMIRVMSSNTIGSRFNGCRATRFRTKWIPARASMVE
ncbi:unnamed protein product [Albugo candida]|uniref:Saposin B-type domain-containing protein n=1 Tax=Albugo candida TaxID=65357 RepID=A0A024FV86_9STRA|nr:unnamed protein product [Albugo candida]|eukprot:CCI10842.1 unnamed protein product [Albugo candida]